MGETEPDTSEDRGGDSHDAAAVYLKEFGLGLLLAVVLFLAVDMIIALDGMKARAEGPDIIRSLKTLGFFAMSPFFLLNVRSIVDFRFPLAGTASAGRSDCHGDQCVASALPPLCNGASALSLVDLWFLDQLRYLQRRLRSDRNLAVRRNGETIYSAVERLVGGWSEPDRADIGNCGRLVKRLP